MKTLKITEETHLKLKKLQLYFKAKTLNETLDLTIDSAAAFEYEHGPMNYELADELEFGENGNK